VSEIDLGSSRRSWRSSAGLGGARALASLVVVDPSVASANWQSSTFEEGDALGVALPLAGPGIELLAWADTLDGARAALDNLCDEGRQRGWLTGGYSRRSRLTTVSSCPQAPRAVPDPSRRRAP